MDTPLAFTWSWPGIDPAIIDPTTVTVSRDPCGRWYVSLAVEVPAPKQLPATGGAVGVDLGITDFAVTSDEQRIPNPGTSNAGPGTWPATSGGSPAASRAARTAPKPSGRPLALTGKSAPPAPTSSTRPAPAWSATTT